jgi:hypothetical protein
MKILKNILSQTGDRREALIREFQTYIWNEEKLPFGEYINDLLRDLAYDLDFCETEESQDLEIKHFLKKVEEHKGS